MDGNVQSTETTLVNINKKLKSQHLIATPSCPIPNPQKCLLRHKFQKAVVEDKKGGKI